MVMRPFFSPVTAAKLIKIRHRGDATGRLMWADTFVVWHLVRPGGWDDGSAPEGWHPVALPAGVPGVGRLMDNGQAGLGDQPAGDVITNTAPFKFRMDKRVPITKDDRLIVNGTRVFEVTVPVETDREADSMWVYLTERIGDSLPVESP